MGWFVYASENVNDCVLSTTIVGAKYCATLSLDKTDVKSPKTDACVGFTPREF